MPDQQNIEMLARYHRWAGERLLTQLAPLNADEWFRDEGLFFKSIHGTLNHLLLVDRLWLGRLIEKPININGLDDILYESREELIVALRQQWQVVLDYAASGDAFDGQSRVRFTNTRNEIYELNKFTIFQHLINHGTHHRGQISAVLTRCGYPAPELDLGYMLYEESDGPAEVS